MEPNSLRDGSTDLHEEARESKVRLGIRCNQKPKSDPEAVEKGSSERFFGSQHAANKEDERLAKVCQDRRARRDLHEPVSVPKERCLQGVGIRSLSLPAQLSPRPTALPKL